MSVSSQYSTPQLTPYSAPTPCLSSPTPSLCSATTVSSTPSLQLSPAHTPVSHAAPHPSFSVPSRRSKMKARALISHVCQHDGEHVSEVDSESESEESEDDESEHTGEGEAEDDVHSVLTTASEATAATVNSSAAEGGSGHTCELCGIFTTVKYGSGRFCGPTCARKYSIITRYKSNKTSHAEYESAAKSQKKKLMKKKKSATDGIVSSKRKRNRNGAKQRSSTASSVSRSARQQEYEAQQSQARWAQIMNNRAQASTAHDSDHQDMQSLQEIMEISSSHIDDMLNDEPIERAFSASPHPAASPALPTTIAALQSQSMPVTTMTDASYAALSAAQKTVPAHISKNASFRAHVPHYMDLSALNQPGAVPAVPAKITVPTPPSGTVFTQSYPIYPFSPLPDQYAIPVQTTKYSLKVDMQPLYTPRDLHNSGSGDASLELPSQETVLSLLSQDSVSASDSSCHPELENKCSYSYPNATATFPHIPSVVTYTPTGSFLQGGWSFDDALPNLLLKLEHRKSSHSKSIQNGLFEQANFQNLFA